MQRRTFLTLPAAWLAPATENKLVTAAPGYSRGSVNASIYCQPLVSHKSNQYMAWYAPDGKLMLGARQVGDSNWAVAATEFAGNTADPHNGISLGLDGEGRLHVAWDHHGHPLRYAQSIEPGGLQLTAKMVMDKVRETRVSRPEFFPLPNGDLLFQYRDGDAGQGDTILKRFDLKTHKWRILANPLIAGEGGRGACTNRIAIDADGNCYTSWSWHDSALAATYDICFATADKNGYWRKADRGPLAPPYTPKHAEVAQAVPAGSDLVYGGSTAFDSKRRPLICSCWREKGDAAPQYRLLVYDGKHWSARQVGARKLDFHLAGAPQPRLPLSRPLLLVDPDDRAIVVHRDAERGPGIHAWIAMPPYETWEARCLDSRPVGDWEPSCDITLWQKQNCLHLFHQYVEQSDSAESRPVSVLEVVL